MTANRDDVSRNSLAGEFDGARLAYGAVLVDDELSMVECVDEDASETDTQRGLLTAMNSVGAELVPYVEGEDPGTDPPDTAVPHRSEAIEPPRVTSFERAVEAVADARACYVVVDRGGGEWRRIRTSDPDAFVGGSIPDSAAGRYLVADAIVAQSSDRMATLADDYDGDPVTTVELIDWTE